MNVYVQPRSRLNVEEFLAWSRRQEDRYELVNGEVVAMSRDTIRHNRTKFAAAQALERAVGGGEQPCLVLIDGVGVKVSDRTVRLPDVVVQCGGAPDLDALVLDAPTIVVEVVSPSSERADAESKLLDYFSVESVQHYLILYSVERAIVHHARDASGHIATLIVREGAVVLDSLGVTVSLDDLLGPPLDNAENAL